MKYVKLVARPDTWFVEGTEVWDYDGEGVRLTLEYWESCNDFIVLAQGIRQAESDCEHEIALFGTEKRIDGECCQCSEFDVTIVDDDGSEVIEEMIKEQLKNF